MRWCFGKSHIPWYNRAINFFVQKFPSISFDLSGTRKEELLYHPEELDKVYGLRRSLKGVPPAEAMEMFIKRVRKTKSNAEFLVSLGS